MTLDQEYAFEQFCDQFELDDKLRARVMDIIMPTTKPPNLGIIKMDEFDESRLKLLSLCDEQRSEMEKVISEIGHLKPEWLADIVDKMGAIEGLTNNLDNMPLLANKWMYVHSHLSRSTQWSFLLFLNEIQIFPHLVGRFTLPLTSTKCANMDRCVHELVVNEVDGMKILELMVPMKMIPEYVYKFVIENKTNPLKQKKSVDQVVRQLIQTPRFYQLTYTLLKSDKPALAAILKPE